MTDHSYLQDLTDARAALKIAEDELAQWRQRAFDEAALQHRAEQAETRIAAARALADDLEAEAAHRIRDALGEATTEARP